MNCQIFIARDKIAFESKRLEKLPESLRVRPLTVIVLLELLGHKVETHTSGKCSVILYRIAFRIGTKRYLVSSERSLSYPPLIPLASRPFFSFQIQENRVNKRRYNILFLALFCLSQCFKETFNGIKPCRLSNVTCNPY